MLRWMALLALGAPGVAWAGDTRDALLALLNAYEEPVREADLKALGEGVDAELVAIASDATIPLTRRGRAISALQFYRTEVVRAFLETQLAPASDGLLRRKALYSLAAFGPAGLRAIVPLLSDPDVQVRIAAANALGSVSDPAAQQALADRSAVEREPAVLDAIRRAQGGGR